MLAFAALLTTLACGSAEDPSSLVEIVPSSPEIWPGDNLKFTASVAGTPDDAVRWTVLETGGGSIDSTGTYTAPDTEGTYTVVASLTSLSATESTQVRVKRNVRAEVTPTSATLAAGESLALSATVTGNVKTVTWSVAEAPEGGTVTPAGVYTAPQTAGTYHVVATTTADPSKSDSATITVTAPPPPQTVTVAVTPKTASVVAGSTTQFAATVSGSTDIGVTWSVAESGGGVVSATGLYTAPATAGTYHVAATSTADPSKSDSATVTVTAPPPPPPPPPTVTIAVTPTTASVVAGSRTQFAATVSGSSDIGVTWWVAESGGGVVSATGLYTAPATAGTYRVAATSKADPSKSDSASVTVTDPPPPPTVTVAVTPTTASVVAGSTMQFAATVSGTTNVGVTWSVVESGGGSVSATGLYAAPATAGTYHVVVTSQADTSKTATAQVTVNPPAPTGVRYPAATSLVKSTQPSMSEPALGASVLFSDLGTTVTRVSDGRHHYAKTPPWNVDESLAVLNDGRILNGKTYAYVRTVSLPAGHKTWSNTDPRYIYGANNSAREWVRLDATTGTRTILATYTQYSSISYGHYEGNMDDADTGAALIGNGVTPFLINPKTGVVRCVVKSGGGFGGSVSDTTMSHDGNYMLVNWKGYGVDAYRATDCSFVRKLTSATSHYDACVSQAGDQVYVSAGGRMIRISDGQLTQVWTDSAYRSHLSCRNTRRPGWAYVSLYNEPCDTTVQGLKAFHRIFAVKLDGSGAVENYAWDHQACPSDYNTYPMAAPSRVGNRVWWKVNWNGSSSLHSFVAERR